MKFTREEKKDMLVGLITTIGVSFGLFAALAAMYLLFEVIL